MHGTICAELPLHAGSVRLVAFAMQVPMAGTPNMPLQMQGIIVWTPTAQLGTGMAIMAEVKTELAFTGMSMEQSIMLVTPTEAVTEEIEESVVTEGMVPMMKELVIKELKEASV